MDIVLQSNKRKELWLLELTICFETLVGDSQQHKTMKLECIVVAGGAVGFKVIVMSIELESRGMLDDGQFQALNVILQHGPGGLAMPQSDQGDAPGVTQDMVLQKCHYLASDYNTHVFV